MSFLTKTLVTAGFLAAGGVLAIGAAMAWISQDFDGHNPEWV